LKAKAQSLHFRIEGKEKEKENRRLCEGK